VNDQRSRDVGARDSPRMSSGTTVDALGLDLQRMTATVIAIDVRIEGR
jgi:hypothetical protein